MPTGPAYVARALSGLPALPGDDERRVTGQVGLQDRQPVQGSLADPPDDEPAVHRVGDEQVLPAGVGGEPDLLRQATLPSGYRQAVVDVAHGSGGGRDVLDGEYPPVTVGQPIGQDGDDEVRAAGAAERLRDEGNRADCRSTTRPRVSEPPPVATLSDQT